ncbi:MAG: PilZ domain-containing protein [Magnetococcus sp. DMHC-1]
MSGFVVTMDRRRHPRLILELPMHLQFLDGLLVDGITRNVSLDGMFLETSTFFSSVIVGEEGIFDIQTTTRTSSLPFEVVRTDATGLGLFIPRDNGIFAYAVSLESPREILSRLTGC